MTTEACRAIDTDLSIARGIRRVLAAESRQLVACGSSRHGESLVRSARCSLLIVPRPPQES